MADLIDDNQENSLGRVVRQFVDARLQGQESDIDEFVKQYPELEHQLRQKLQSLGEIDTLFDSLFQATKSDFTGDIVGHDLVGRRVGGFEIVEMIGRGGMGIVYLAHDTKLKRSVAIKSMPPQFACDSTARTRFRREAELLAALNHPNIAVIHDVVEEKESRYLVLEYVPGQTLAQLIAHKSLKLEEALSIGEQVAEAVSAAHDKGVIHRDLKPGNIKITPDGRVKVLDFGLAKAYTSEVTAEEATVTQPGRLMGTPAYMSPEQACGKPTDKRSDIWSFGCLMYEMLTGHLPFEGQTATEILARIIEREPDWELLPQDTPTNIRTLLRRCLEKDPHRRLRDIGDASIEISETLSGTSEAFSLLEKSQGLPNDITVVPRLFQRNVILACLACLVAGALIAGVIIMSLVRPTPPKAPVASRLSISIPADKPLLSGRSPNCYLAISPDGTRVVYVGELDDGTPHLYVRSLEELKIKPIPGTSKAHNPFFSPDGQWVGFFTHQDELKKVSLAGGEPLRLCENIPLGAAAFGSWADDGSIVYSTFDTDRGIQRISEDGDQPEILIAPVPDEGKVGYRYPQVLPEGNAILYTKGSRIEVFVQETGARQTVLDDATYAQYVTSGHLIFVRDRVLLVAPFDIERFKITGPLAVLVDDVGFDWGGKTPQMAISRNGTIVYISGSEFRKNELVWVDRQGLSEPLDAPAHVYQNPRLSPDGQRVAVVIRSQEKHISQVYVYDILRGALAHLTAEGGNGWPQWSPDSKRIAFWSHSSEESGVFCKTVDDSAPAELLASMPSPEIRLSPYSWSYDGSLLACTVQDPNTQDDIWNVELDGDRKAKPFLVTEYQEYNPTFSPNGQWLAYVSDESGRPEVYLRQYTDGGRRITVSTEGGINPVWSRDGRELYYINGTNMMVVRISLEPDFDVGPPERLFEGSYVTQPGGNLWANYDISDDGRFLMLKKSDDAEVQLICVHNWFEELKRLAPTRKK